jgi:hypothetical protein
MKDALQIGWAAGIWPGRLNGIKKRSASEGGPYKIGRFGSN